MKRAQVCLLTPLPINACVSATLFNVGFYQVLNSWATPSVLFPRVPRDVFATRSWREPSKLQHIRSGSTAQSTKPWEGYSRASSFMYAESDAESPSQKVKSSAAKQLPAQGIRVTAWKSPSNDPSVEAKRRAERHSGIPLAQQSHKEPALKLKNDPSQDQIYVPTQKDYPDLPRSVFTLPKMHIHNAMQGKAIGNIEFFERKDRRDRTSGIRCTVTYTFLGGDDPVTGIGEGSNKVILADESMNCLTVPRNLPRWLHF